MSKKLSSTIGRVVAVLMVLLLLLLPAAAMNNWASVSAAESKPSFRIEVDATALYAGDTAVVSFYVNNDTGHTITSFDGYIDYNPSLLAYAQAECFAQTVDVNDHQTVTSILDDSNGSAKVRFTFSDSTGAVLPSNGADVLFLRVNLTMKAAEGNGSITGRIDHCYHGTEEFGTIGIAQKIITVLTTSAPTNSTTAPSAQSQTPKSADARLSSLMVSDGKLFPDFNPEFVAYTMTVPYEVANIRISAQCNSTKATVMGEGVKDLSVGTNTFTVSVIAENGATRDYGIIIVREEEKPLVLTAVNEDYTTNSDAGLSTATTTEETTPATSFATTARLIVSSADIDERPTSPLSSQEDVLKLVGIVFGEIALFFFGFLAGYFIDKNMKKRAQAEEKLAALTRSDRNDYASYEEYPEQAEEYYRQYDDYSGYQEYPDGSLLDGQMYEGYNSLNDYDGQYPDQFGQYNSPNDPYEQ